LLSPLEGKVALITGASRGIGAAAVRAFVAAARASCSTKTRESPGGGPRESLWRGTLRLRCLRSFRFEGAKDLVDETVSASGGWTILVAKPRDMAPEDAPSTNDRPQWQAPSRKSGQRFFSGAAFGWAHEEQKKLGTGAGRAHCARQFDGGPARRSFSRG